MKRIKKILRISLLIFLIILACTGVGIFGAIPIFPSPRDRNSREKDKTEWVQEKKKDNHVKQIG